jgi:hypothetical protein
VLFWMILKEMSYCFCYRVSGVVLFCFIHVIYGSLRFCG